LLQHRTGAAADAHLQTLHIGYAFQLLAEEAAHLRAGVARREVDDVVALEELAHQLQPAAVVHPRVLLARAHTEWDRAGEGERRVLAEEIIWRGMAAFDRRVLHRVDDAKCWTEPASRQPLDLDLIAGERWHA